MCEPEVQLLSYNSAPKLASTLIRQIRLNNQQSLRRGKRPEHIRHLCFKEPLSTDHPACICQYWHHGCWEEFARPKSRSCSNHDFWSLLRFIPVHIQYNTPQNSNLLHHYLQTCQSFSFTFHHVKPSLNST